MFESDIHLDLFTKAAVLLRSLTQNHPFIDGNKRVAWLSMRAFLDANGIEIRALPSQVETMMLDLVTGTGTLETLVEFLFAHSTFVTDIRPESGRGDDTKELMEENSSVLRPPGSSLLQLPSSSAIASRSIAAYQTNGIRRYRTRVWYRT